MRTKLLMPLVAGALVAVGAATHAGAGNGGPIVTVNKIVIGTPPPGTEFIVEYECAPINGATEPTAQGEIAGELVFGPGGGTEQVPIEFGTDCTFEETGNGGAVQTLLDVICQQSQNCQQTGPNTVFFRLDSREEPGATFTFTNLFDTPPPPPPPEPLPVEPAFTG